ncbi:MULTISPECIES: hypothetical protein [Bacillus]|uniref:hypothetical protein n=1 Tax=Bacillus TaxID=1386 RepID=UPI0002E8B7A9|nr:MULTISPECIES: hypothetical protein [Bacillus]
MTITCNELEDGSILKMSEVAKKILLYLEKKFTVYHYALTSSRKNTDIGVELTGLFNKMIRSDKVAFAPVGEMEWNSESLSSYSIVGFKNITECLHDIQGSIAGYDDLEDSLLDSESEVFLFEYYEGVMIKIHCNGFSDYIALKNLLNE